MSDTAIREVRPGESITLQALGFPAGQTPTVRLILLVNASVAIAPTLGATEDSPGNYDLALAIPATLPEGDYAAEWDFGGVWYRDDEIVRVTGRPLAEATGGYTTVEDLRFALAPGGAVDPATASSLTDAELADAIREASAEVDAELAGPYTVPLDPVPPIVARIARDIAAYLATLTYRRSVPLEPNDPIRLRGDQARALLRRIGEGKADLVGATGAVAVSGSAEVVNPYSGAMWETLV